MCCGGIFVEEVIDDEFILAKDESHKSPVQQVFNDGKDIADKFLGDGFQMVKEYFADSD